MEEFALAIVTVCCGGAGCSSSVRRCAGFCRRHAAQGDTQIEGLTEFNGAATCAC
jgi:hypothetical protein